MSATEQERVTNEAIAERRRIQFSLSEALASKLEKLAATKGFKVTDYLPMLVSEECERRGLL